MGIILKNILTGSENPYEATETGNVEEIITIKRDITERKRGEGELMKHREHLEELVKERTTELRMVNKQLQQEIAERKRAERAVQEAREYAESIVETGNWESLFLMVS
jgi:phosphoglycerate-specific signal transduction histidine kinase